MPFNVDKNARDIAISVTLARPAILYVFFDHRARRPDWLTRQFTDTGWNIGLDEGKSPEKNLTTRTGPGRSIDTVFSVWKRELDGPGTVTLGSMIDRNHGKAMYGIAAKARRRDRDVTGGICDDETNVDASPLDAELRRRRGRGAVLEPG